MGTKSDKVLFNDTLFNDIQCLAIQTLKTHGMLPWRGQVSTRTLQIGMVYQPWLSQAMIFPLKAALVDTDTATQKDPSPGEFSLAPSTPFLLVTKRLAAESI